MPTIKKTQRGRGAEGQRGKRSRLSASFLPCSPAPLLPISLLIVGIVGIVGIFFNVGIVFSEPSPPLVTEQWINFAIHKLETNQISGGIHINTRPLSREEVARLILKSKERLELGVVKATPFEQKLIKKLETEFADELSDLSGQDEKTAFKLKALPQLRLSDTSKKNSAGFEGAAIYGNSDKFTLYEEVEVGKISDEKYPKIGATASSRLNIWRRNYAADFERAFLSFSLSRFNLLIGRESLFWGPSQKSALAISDNSPPFDLIWLKGKLGKVKASSFIAMLDNMWGQRGFPSQRYLANRYLSAHRIDWQLNDNLELGVSEIILYGGEARNFQLQYLNPVMPYYASQYNSKLDDNVLFSFDGAIKPIAGLKLYAEFLIDDFQYGKTDDPNAVGLLTGLHLSRNPILLTSMLDFDFNFKAEYSRINRWAYTHLVPENQYTHFGSSLGHPLGNDADELYLELTLPLNVDLFLSFSYDYRRQGEAKIEDRYKGEYRNEARPASKFPSGVVESTHRPRFEIFYEPLCGWIANLALERAEIRNEGHILAKNKGENRINFNIKYSITTRQKFPHHSLTFQKRLQGRFSGCRLE